MSEEVADSFRLFYDGGSPYGRRIRTKDEAAILYRLDPAQQAYRLISRHELRVWFEPDWRVARLLAAEFPSCAVFSIPFESHTANLRKIPGWRPRRATGAVL